MGKERPVTQMSCYTCQQRSGGHWENIIQLPFYLREIQNMEHAQLLTDELEESQGK